MRSGRQNHALVALAEPFVAISRQDVIGPIAQGSRYVAKEGDPSPGGKAARRGNAGIRFEQHASLVDKGKSLGEIEIDAETRRDFISPRRLAGDIGELPGRIAAKKEAHTA